MRPLAWSGAAAMALVAWGASCSGESAAEEHGREHAPGSAEPHAAEPRRAAPHRPELHQSEPHDEHGTEVTLAPEAVRAQGIEIGAAVRRALAPTFRAPARVAFNAERMAHVGSPVRGRVTEVRVLIGAEVEKGAGLLVIESAELGEAQAEYLQKRSSARTAGPAVDLARNAHERARTLYEESQGIALTEVQKREAELHAAEAALAAARTAEQAAKNRLHLLGMTEEAVVRLADTGAIEARFTVFAPIGGQVIEREVTLGELVGPERDALLVLADTRKLWVLADVPEARLGDVAVGSQARVLLGAGRGHWCEGVVTFVSPSLDPATRSVQARIEASDRHPELRPGVFAQAEIEVASAGAGEPLVTVPEGALQTIEGASCVFVPVAGREGVFARRDVAAGPAVGGVVPVYSGLAQGEPVVVAGSFILKAELGKGAAEHEH